MSVRIQTAVLLVLTGTSTVLAGTTSDHPYVINISGANLLESFFTAPASTNDFIDVDGDGTPIHPVSASTPFSGPDQLAPFSVTPPFAADHQWIVQYRSVNAGSGLSELINWGTRWAESAGTNSTNGDLRYDDTGLDVGYSNRTIWKTRPTSVPGVLQSIANTTHPGAAPFISDETTLQGVLGPVAHSSVGLRIDLATLDSPTLWNLAVPGGTSSVSVLPGVLGYGSNERLAVNAASGGFTFTDANGQAVTQGHKLVSLTSADGLATLNVHTAAPDVNTIFDTPLGYVISGVVTNFGTGRESISFTDLRYLSTTGRTSTGENLVFITRDSLAGARNIFQASIGIDPSWGVGENVGLRDNNTAKDSLGVQFVPSNKSASGSLETTVTNHRLGIGYTGADRGRGRFLTSGSLEYLAILDDLHTRPAGYTAAPVRPSIDKVLHNGLAGQLRPDGSVNPTDGYRLGGPETVSTIGDPRAATAQLGGAGWPQTYYVSGDPRAVFEAPNTNPPLRNPHAAAYLNNITRSITAFNAAPGSDPTIFSPGEYLAFQYVLPGSLDFVQTGDDPTAWVSNAQQTSLLQNYTLANNALGDPAYQTFGVAAAAAASPAGKVPIRLGLPAGQHYSDGVDTGANYLAQDGSAVAYAGKLKLRNLVAGDFNGDGARTINDVQDLVAAYRQRWDASHPVWSAPSGSQALLSKANSLGVTVSGSDAVIEILGDFNGDGTFDLKDVRYWADGLAVATSGAHAGKLDRKAGFVAVDNASQTFGGSANFFATTLATGVSYTAGASRADLVGSGRNRTTGGIVLTDASGTQSIDAFKTARGFAPIAADGLIDANDIDYVYANIRAAANNADWGSFNRAITFDLAADINGDLKVDQNDVAELLSILNTVSGDVNLDGVKNAADAAIIQANIGRTSSASFTVGWATGDANGDGVIDASDLAVGGLRSDFNHDNVRDVADLFAYINAWLAKTPNADFNADAVVDVADLFAFINAWLAGI